MKHIGLSILATVLLAACTARAGTIDIVLDPSTLSGSTGSVLQFFGTLTNTTDADVYLNADIFNGAIPLTAINDLFNNTPLSLPANGSTGGDIELFDVTILPSFTLPSYGGTYTLLGGSVQNDSQDSLGSVGFTVQVVPASGVPEPNTLPLLGVGAGALLLWGRVMRGIGRCGAR